jgi:hypothetical protein
MTGWRKLPYKKLCCEGTDVLICEGHSCHTLGIVEQSREENTVVVKLPSHARPAICC